MLKPAHFITDTLNGQYIQHMDDNLQMICEIHTEPCVVIYTYEYTLH